MTIDEFMESPDYMPSPELDSYLGQDVFLGPPVIDLDKCRWARPVLCRRDGILRKLGCVPRKGPKE